MYFTLSIHCTENMQADFAEVWQASGNLDVKLQVFDELKSPAWLLSFDV